MLEYKVLGNVRGKRAQNFAEGSDSEFQIDNQGDLLIAQALPELTDLILKNQSYQVITSTALAPLTAIPTTTAALSLWNGEPDTGKAYVIDSVFAVKIANDATASIIAIQAMINVGKIPAAIANTLTPKGLMGQVYGGKGRVAVGTTVVNDGWFPLGNACPVVPAAAVEIGQQIEVPVKGLYIVLPSFQFNLHVLASVATASSLQLGVRWHEVQLIAAS